MVSSNKFFAFLRRYLMVVRMAFDSKLNDLNLFNIEPRVAPDMTETYTLYINQVDAAVTINYADGDFYASIKLSWETIHEEGLEVLELAICEMISDKKKKYLDGMAKLQGPHNKPAPKPISPPWSISGSEVKAVIQKAFPNLDLTKKLKCPACYTKKDRTRGNIFDVIMHLNDTHGLSREQIADWVETLSDIDIYSDVKKEDINADIG